MSLYYKRTMCSHTADTGINNYDHNTSESFPSPCFTDSCSTWSLPALASCACFWPRVLRALCRLLLRIESGLKDCCAYALHNAYVRHCFTALSLPPSSWNVFGLCFKLVRCTGDSRCKVLPCNEFHAIANGWTGTELRPCRSRSVQ